MEASKKQEIKENRHTDGEDKLIVKLAGDEPEDDS